MKFMSILKTPFKYNKNYDKLELKDSLINIGISMAIVIVTILLSINIISSRMLGGFSMGMSIPGKVYGTAFASMLVGIILATLAVVTIIFFVRKMVFSDSTFNQSLSIFSTAVVLPSVIMSATLIGAVISGVVGMYIAGIVIMVAAYSLIFNIYETLNIVGGIGSGKAVYLTSISIVVYYGLTAFVTGMILKDSLAQSLGMLSYLF
ncbi:hypothetical protein [Clostridium vincentii]|uniref:Yip1 domain protein n=1 Tax=Clostridium vincentii TaxID=52704 RepID=A0A2T0B8I7_9CLOT|nr:hypothetical protein [Clostridium vincentii]PRR80210.1 hypothetical protein CLVI_31120 [Clostridium vincentii]